MERNRQSLFWGEGGGYPTSSAAPPRPLPSFQGSIVVQGPPNSDWCCPSARCLPSAERILVG